MSRIASRLKHSGRGFIPFITAGDPDLASSLDLAVALGRTCADVLELGVPFSDPVADGPVIQRSSLRALQQGTTVQTTLDLVRRMRVHTDVPVVLFSYFNPILQYGMERFSSEARDAGVDGLLLTDLPPEESGPYLDCLHEKGVDTVFLASPTTSPRRLKKIAAASRGFVYLISRTGVTGERDALPGEVHGKVADLRRETDLPVAVGFGISRPEHVSRIWEIADAAVVGSALVHRIEELADDSARIEKAVEFAQWLRGVPS